MTNFRTLYSYFRWLWNTPCNGCHCCDYEKGAKRRRQQQKDWIKVHDLVKNKGILISAYDFSVCGLKNIISESYEKLKWIYNTNISISADRFWYTSDLFSTHEYPRPNWSGYMQNISKGSHQKKSKVLLLLILNLNPNNEMCIYSVLLFVIDQCKKMNIDDPLVTFDQPLWLKALGITTAKRLRIIPILSSFHMVMSFY